MPAILIAILAFSSLGTAFVSGILGMAGGMILMGILLAFLPVPAAMALHGITQFASNAGRAWMWRREVDWQVFRRYTAGALAAFAVFAIAGIVVSKTAAFLALGLMPFIALALPDRLQLGVERRGHAETCGALCSALSLTAGISGPVLDVFFARTPMTRQAVVATKAMSQCVSHLLKVLYFVALAAGAKAAVDPWAAAAMVALALAGTHLSRRALEAMSEASFRFWTRWTVIAAGVFYLGSAAMLML